MRRRATAAPCVGVVVALVMAGTAAPGGASAAAQDGRPDWLTRDTLTGDWGGGRTWLREHGSR